MRIMSISNTRIVALSWNNGIFIFNLKRSEKEEGEEGDERIKGMSLFE